MLCCLGGKIERIVACAVEMSAAPPAPCMIRQKTRPHKLPEIPHINEANVKNAIEAARYCRRPKRAENQPVSGRTITFATIYPVETQPISSKVAPKFPCICGMAVETMVVSRISKTAPNTTAAKTIQRVRTV